MSFGSTDTSDKEAWMGAASDSDDCCAASDAGCPSESLGLCDGNGEDLSGVKGSSCGYFVFREGLFAS